MITQEEHFDRCARYLDTHDRAQNVLADNAGVLPVPIVGTLLSLYDATRPAFNSFTSRPMPDGAKTFTRPKITQHVAVGEQVAEFDPVASQKMIITGSNVTKKTEAGYLDLSQQDVDWTSPSMLDLVIQDFARVYSRRLETTAIAFLEAAAVTTSAYVATDLHTLVTSFVDAATTVYNATDGAYFPDTVWLDIGSYALLAKTLNTTGETNALEQIQNAMGKIGAGEPTGPFKLVIGRFTAPAIIVGSSALIESYEQTRGLLRVAQPDVLGQRIAYYGYHAYFAESSAFAKLA
jgi:hypothetical protein